MTTASTPIFSWPDWDAGRPNLTALTTSAQTIGTLDTASDAFAWAGPSPATGTLTDFYFRIGTTSITSGPLNFDGRIETVSAGRPTGTLYGTNTNGAVSIADTDDNTWKTCTLTSSASVTRGTDMAVVVKAPGSGTFSVAWSGFSGNTGLVPVPQIWPLAMLDTNGDGTYDAFVTNSPCMAVKISGVIYPLSGCNIYDSIAVSTYNSGSAADEKALRIYSSVPRRVVGIEACMSNIASGANLTLTLWPSSSSSDGDALGQYAFSGSAPGSTNQDGWVGGLFSSATTISANTEYWAGVRADTANNAILVIPNVAGITNILEASRGGTGCYLGTRSWPTPGSFTGDSTQVPLIRLLCDGLDDGAGGSGGGGQRVIGS